MGIENSLRKIKNFIENFPIHSYYEVPTCPNCNSPITGRYCREYQKEDKGWAKKEALLHGELIVPVKDVPICNFFCLDCDYNWAGDVKFKLISAKEMKRQRMIKSTGTMYQQYVEQEEEEKKEYKKNHKILSSIKKITGL